MPGYLYHLSFAQNVYNALLKHIRLDKISFMSGNILPDLATDKNKSHYRISASVKELFIPDMEQVQSELFVPNNSLLFGMYCHLFLDYHFTEKFLIPEFEWDFKNGKVKKPELNKEWDIKTFFSKDGIYGAYDSINSLMLRDGIISTKTIEEIPLILPNTGITVFDTRHDKTWKLELDEYLKQENIYTGDIFEYEKLISFIENISSEFISSFGEKTTS